MFWRSAFSPHCTMRFRPVAYERDKVRLKYLLSAVHLGHEHGQQLAHQKRICVWCSPAPSTSTSSSGISRAKTAQSSAMTER